MIIRLVRNQSVLKDTADYDKIGDELRETDGRLRAIRYVHSRKYVSRVYPALTGDLAAEPARRERASEQRSCQLQLTE